MQFCEKCGNKVSAAYCAKCGEAKQSALPQMNVSHAESKFCPTCGKSVTAAYCAGCGTARSINVDFGRAPAGPRVSFNKTGAGAGVAVAGLPAPIEWLLMGIVLLFALSTMSFFGGLMLAVALVPAFVLTFDRNLYAKLKLILGAGAVGAGLVFAVLATFTGAIRLHPIALVLCILGLLFIAFISVRDLIGVRLPDEVESFVDGPMYFYIIAIYFAVVTVFVRVVVVLRIFGFREVFAGNIHAGRMFLSVVFIVLLLAPATTVAYLIWRGMTGLLDKALVALGGSAIFAIIIMPTFFRNSGPIIFTLLGFGGVAIVALVVFTYKDAVMQAFGAGAAGGAALPSAQPYQAPGIGAPGGYSPAAGPGPGGRPPVGAPGGGYPQQPMGAPGGGGYPQQPMGAPGPGGYPYQPGVTATGPDGTTVNVNVMMPGYRPVGQLKTNRSLLVTILLSIVTCGIYQIIQFSSISTDINIIAQRYDGRKTMHYCLLLFVISPITCGIAAIVWFHKLSDRIGHELRRRGIAYNFGAGTYWLWFYLGSMLLGIGPLVYLYKLFTAMNLLSADYNVNG